MNKIEKYRNLVHKRKQCFLCQCLHNPASIDKGKWDSDQIGPWSLWQASLDAELIIVGQDWGDVSYFKKWEGRDQPSGNPTNENLQKLLGTIGIDVRKPREVQHQIVFFTNIILCLKTGGLQSPVEEQWFQNCSVAFFKPLVEIIKPIAVLALGKKVSESIFEIYGIQQPKNTPLSDKIKQAPYQLTDSTVLFPLYHCGAGGVNRNRSMEKQMDDWSHIKKFLNNNGFR